MADKEFKIVINTNTGDVKQAMAQVATAIEAVGGKIDEVNNNSGFDNVIKKLDKVSSSMTSMGKSMTAKVTLPLMGIGTMAVKTFSDFEYGMKKVQAVTGASSNELAKMTEMARDLGANTEYSATQAAEGMFDLSTAGFTVEETMQAIPGLLDMATAAQTDLGTATEIAAGTLRGFGMGAGDITQVADVLAYTANNTNASITDLGLGMSYVAPIAKTAGISLEETSAILGKLSDANLKGEKAGTALRGMMARLLDPSKEAVGTL
jgi:TP901 family phage tail tape measure protein